MLGDGRDIDCYIRVPITVKSIAMSKAVSRCRWAEGVSLDYIEYHDKEWGVPVWDDRRQFEFLVLEGAQAGLSWSTILNKRDGYRKAVRRIRSGEGRAFHKQAR